MVGGSAEFEALPATTKADYLRGYEVQDLMWHGDIAGCGTWSSTSGSSGVPTFVPRDEVALDDAVDAHERISPRRLRRRYPNDARHRVLCDGHLDRRDLYLPGDAGSA